MLRNAVLALVLLSSSAYAVAPDPAADLHALGLEVLAKVDQIAPLDARHGAAGQDEIPALGACTRPTVSDRAVLRYVVTRGIADDNLYEVRFGCMDARGVIVSVAYDVVAGTQRTGAWDVVLVAGGKATKIESFRGLSRMNYAEWSNEVSVDVGLLVDLDSDGVHDALLVRTIHEGGSIHSDEELSLWWSRSGRVTRAGAFGDDVTVARGQLAAPIVLEVSRLNDPTRYRCLEADGTIDLCSAIEGARHVDRVVEIARSFAGPLPDRDLLAEQLDEIGVEPNRRAHLLQQAAVTAGGQRVAREIERAVAPKPVRRFGEIVENQPPDPRPAEIMALAGDTPCSMTDADQRALVRRVAKIAAKPAIVAACGDQTHGYVAVHWTHDDVKNNELTARDVVFAISASELRPLVSTTVTGPRTSCAACDTQPPGIAIDSSFYRHDGAFIALVLDLSHEQPVLALAVDGKAAAVPPGTFVRARLREPEGTLGDIVETGGKGVAFWHWDGSWKLVVEVPFTAGDAPSGLDPLGRRLWQESARVFAIWSLRNFDAKAWAADPAVRAATRHHLELAGADPATVARVSANEPSH